MDSSDSLLQVKLGRKIVPADPRNLRFSKYLTNSLVNPPPSLMWGAQPAWGVMLNNSLGDCVCACVGHSELAWSANANGLLNDRPTDAQVQELYQNACGYVPGNPSTDNGCSMQAVLNYWRTYGIAMGSFNASSGPTTKASLKIYGSAGNVIVPHAKPTWSFFNPSGKFTNVVSADGQTATISCSTTDQETITVSYGGTTNSVTIAGPTTNVRFQAPATAYRKILAYTQLASAAFHAQTPAQTQREAQLAIQLFGGAFIALQLPTYIQGNYSVWDYTGQQWSLWGGHCVLCIGYDPTGVYFVTWGRVVKMTWAFYFNFVDEPYAVLSMDWQNNQTKLMESGFDLKTLQTDLALITQ